MPNYVTNDVVFEANSQEMDKILHLLQRDGDVLGSFDFNKLIPMPKSLDITEGSIKDESVNAFVSNLKANMVNHPDHPEISFDDAKCYIETGAQLLKGFFFKEPPKPMTAEEISTAAEKYNMAVPEFLALGKLYLDNQLQHGASTWYEWCTHNWGTKWNTQKGDLLSGGNSLRFDTAWSAPLPIMKALSIHCPNIPIQHTWADEDIGQNVGKLTYLNGRVIDAYIPEPGSLEAYDLAFETLQVDPADYCLRYDVKSGTYVYDESLFEMDEPERPSLDNVLDLAKIKATLQNEPTKESPGKDLPER